MNCEQARTILIDSKADPKSAIWIEAVDHSTHCGECQFDAQFERHLSAWLDDSVQPNDEVWSRIETRVTNPTLELWMNPINKKDNMKRNIITSSVAAATVIVGFGLFTQSAFASTPKSKFIAMKKAVLAAPKQGKIDGWAITLDGQMIELMEGQYTFEPTKDTKVVQGSPIGPVKTDAKTSSAKPIVVQGFKLDLDLNENHYESIRFGKNQNELVLTQKGRNGSRYVVQLDKKSGAPTYLALQAQEKGGWQLVKGKQITYTVNLPLKGN